MANGRGATTRDEMRLWADRFCTFDRCRLVPSDRTTGLAGWRAQRPQRGSHIGWRISRRGKWWARPALGKKKCKNSFLTRTARNGAPVFARFTEPRPAYE